MFSHLVLNKKAEDSTYDFLPIPPQTPQRVHHAVKKADVFGYNLGNTIEHGMVAQVNSITG